MSYGGAAKCMRCNKSVYMADEVLAAGGKWHKLCFKCKECNVSLSRCCHCPHTVCCILLGQQQSFCVLFRNNSAFSITLLFPLNDLFTFH